MVTNILLMEWLSKGNGIAKTRVCHNVFLIFGSCSEDLLDKPIREQIRIRKYNDTEWHIPTKEYMEIE